MININHNLDSSNDFTYKIKKIKIKKHVSWNGFCEWINNHFTCR